MIVGVNALYLLPGGVGGTESYLRQLLQAIARIDAVHQYVVFVNRETGADLVPARSNWRFRRLPVAAQNRPLRIAYEQLILPFEVRRARVDVLFNPGYTGPRWAGVPQVTVFHDLQHVRHPEHFRKADLLFWRLLLAQSAMRSAKLIAVSNATRMDVEAHYGLAPGKVVTIHHGVDEECFGLSGAVRSDPPLILCVSTLHPHKNIERLLRAFAQIRRRRPGLSLVLAGMRGFHTTRIQAVIDELELKEAVTVTGWIARAELYRLYATASVFVYPSTFEGFGMPVLEAMAAGLPVACSAIAPHREIGGDAALFFDPQSVEAVERAIETILTDDETADALRRAGPERAKRFSWEETARRTLSVLAAAARAR